MKAVPGILPTLLEMICFFSTPTIDVEPEKHHVRAHQLGIQAVGNVDDHDRQYGRDHNDSLFLFILVSFCIVAEIK